MIVMLMMMMITIIVMVMPGDGAAIVQQRNIVCARVDSAMRISDCVNVLFHMLWVLCCWAMHMPTLTSPHRIASMSFSRKNTHYDYPTLSPHRHTDRYTALSTRRTRRTRHLTRLLGPCHTYATNGTLATQSHYWQLELVRNQQKNKTEPVVALGAIWSRFPFVIFAAQGCGK